MSPSFLLLLTPSLFFSAFSHLENISPLPCPVTTRSFNALSRFFSHIHHVRFIPLLLFVSPAYTYISLFRSAIEPPPNNLKERIAALQQRSGSPSPAPSPTPPPRDASLTPPRGSLRDKIAKFERKGGVPIPRSSFGLGAPPVEDAGSTKSRELYGNRVAALGKGRPTAPGNSPHRAATSPATLATSPSFRNSPDDNASEAATELTPDSIGDVVSPSVPPSRLDSSSLTDRPVGSLDATNGSDEAQETSVQPAGGARLESLTRTQHANASEPSKANVKSTVSMGQHPPSVSNTSSSTSLVVTTPTLSDVSSTPLRTTSSDGTPTQVGSDGQECPPVKSDVSTVQPHITVEEVPVKETNVSANSRGFRLDRPPQNGSLAVSSMHSVASSDTELPSLSIISSEDNLKEGPTSITSDASIQNKIKTNILPSSSSTSASSVVFPSNIRTTVPPISGDSEEPTTISQPPVAEPGHRSFTAVVHRGDGDSNRDSRHSTASRSSTVTPRPSTSSFKTGTDGGVVRSKRNFKHLGAVAVDPPPSPGLGDLGVGDLASLLQEAAWLEQRLYDENVIAPSALGEVREKAENSAPSPATTKTGQATAPAVTTSTRTKGRGLILGSLTSAPSSHTSQSPIRLSPSTPSFQVHPDTSPTQPKSARGRKYFSLRGAFRGQRLSVSSEMSSDDSAPVATPPSPSFDLQVGQGHSNDSMSIRSMFSIRSNKSGKSDSAPGSLRLSPRRGVSRASSFAERLLNRASKTKSVLDDSSETSSL